MKTLILFEMIPEDSFFFEASGDFRQLQDIYINCCDDKNLIKELTELVYTDDGEIKVEKLKEPTKDWDFFVKCGIVY